MKPMTSRTNLTLTASGFATSGILTVEITGWSMPDAIERAQEASKLIANKSYYRFQLYSRQLEGHLEDKAELIAHWEVEVKPVVMNFTQSTKVPA